MVNKKTTKDTTKPVRFSEDLFKIQIGKLVENGFKVVQSDAYEMTFVGEISNVEICDMLLACNNPDNRRISVRNRSKIVDSLKHGEWVYTGQPIILGVNGMLGDGQTRLSAIRNVLANSKDTNVSFRVKITYLRDCGIVNGLYKIMGQQKAVTNGDILRKEGFESSAVSTITNVMISWASGKLGNAINYRSQLVVDFANDYREGLLRTSKQVYRQYVNITSSMCAAVLIIGRAFRREEDAYQFLERCADLSYVLDPRAKANNSSVADLEDGLPEKSIAYWLANGGVSIIKDGRKISSNGLFAVQEAVSVMGRGLICHLLGRSYTDRDIRKSHTNRGWNDVLRDTKRMADINGVRLFVEM